jgi:hypothetical protein
MPELPAAAPDGLDSAAAAAIAHAYALRTDEDGRAACYMISPIDTTDLIEALSAVAPNAHGFA